MHGPTRSLTLTTVLLGIVCNSPPTSAAEFRSGEKVVVKADETINDDLYVCGRTITIDGIVEGDVLAFGEQITVNGTVKGHVMAAGQTIVLLGQSEGARVAGQVIKIDSKAKIDGDLLGAGFSLECMPDSQIAQDALFAGYQALFAGKIGNNLWGAMANCRLEGTTKGDVLVEAGGKKDAPPASMFGLPPPVPFPNVPGGLTLAESAEIEGDLAYESPQEAKIDPAAKVSGEITFHKPKPTEKKGKAGAAVGPSFSTLVWNRLRHLVCVTIVGLAALLLFPQWTSTWAETIRTRPGASFLSGLASLAGVVVLLVFALVAIILAAVLFGVARLTELVPLVIVGGIVGYAAFLVGFWIVSSFLAEALTGLAVGRMAMNQDSSGARFGALLLGIMLLGAILSVPYLGGVAGFVVMVFGLGSITLWLMGQAPPQSFVPLPVGKPMPA